MKALLCEPEDRLGSQASASVFRPDSLAIQARRSGFILSASGTSDGADMIKACCLHTPFVYVLMALGVIGPPMVQRH